MGKYLFTFLAIASSLVMQAADLTFSITDPTNDVKSFPGGAPVAGGIDAMSLIFSFSNTTGEYAITVTADSARPFVGSLVVNVNLYNVDAATRTNSTLGFFQRSTPRNLIAPQTTLTVTGVDSKLTFWAAGDRVAYNSGPFGGPTAFGSNVYAACTPGGCSISDPFGALSASDYAVLNAADPTRNRLLNPNFDGSLDAWTTLTNLLPSSFYDSSRNASGAGSGSFKAVQDVDYSNNGFCAPAPNCVTFPVLRQCVPVTAGKTYNFGVKVLIPSGQTRTGEGHAGLDFYSGGACSGSFLGIATSSVVSSDRRWTSSAGQVQAPAGATSAMVTLYHTRNLKNGVLQINYDEVYLEESGTGSGCPVIVDPVNQVPVTSTGFSRSFKYADTALGFTGTNVGSTPVLNPFVLILDYRSGTGATVTLRNPSTNCIKGTSQHYVPLAKSLAPGKKATNTAEFDTPNTFYGGLFVTWRNRALSGLR